MGFVVLCLFVTCLYCMLVVLLVLFACVILFWILAFISLLTGFAVYRFDCLLFAGLFCFVDFFVLLFVLDLFSLVCVFNVLCCGLAFCVLYTLCLTCLLVWFVWFSWFVCLTCLSVWFDVCCCLILFWTWIRLYTGFVLWFCFSIVCFELLLLDFVCVLVLCVLFSFGDLIIDCFDCGCLRGMGDLTVFDLFRLMVY